MAATSGPYGSRKSLSDVFPRLTGKSIPLIANQLISYERDVPKNEDGVFLTGLLFCNLWKDNNESSINQMYYDQSFAGFSDDPAGCVEMYLRKNDVYDGMEQLIESALKQGYITYDPIPYVGKIHIRGISGEKLGELQQEDVIDNLMQDYPGPGSVTEGTKIFQIINNIYWSGQGKGSDWYQLIMGLAGSRSGTIVDEEPGLDEYLKTYNAVSNDLDITVKNTILKEKIIFNNKIIGTIKLSWD